MKKQTLKPKLPSLLRWILWVLLVQFILINISAALYAYKLTHYYTDPGLRDSKPPKNILAKTWRLFAGPRQPRSVITDVPLFAYDTVILKTSKNLLVDAWYATADSNAKGTVIMFHGVTINKGWMMAEANEFRYMGFNILMVDFRGHGNSEGNLTTMGVRETEEVKLAVDWVKSRGEDQILLWGSSMGAAVIAKAIYDYSLQPAGIILEMPFASLRSHLEARSRMLGFAGFPETPFGFFVTSWIGIEQGFNGFKHSVPRYAAKIHCPVLMQWGAQDETVLMSETDKIFEAISAARKKLVIYQHAGHESLLQNEPAKWRDEVSGFMESLDP